MAEPDALLGSSPATWKTENLELLGPLPNKLIMSVTFAVHKVWYVGFTSKLLSGPLKKKKVFTCFQSKHSRKYRVREDGGLELRNLF